MPVHDLGYRRWDGNRTAHFLRPFDVARSGVSLVWGRKWIRLMLFLAWLPIIVPAFGIFAFEYSSTEPGARRTIAGLMRSPMIGRPELAMQVLVDQDSARNEVWSTLILTFFRYPQLVAMVLLVGLIAPMLVSYDLRSKAYLMYFSRPLTPTEYILGKSAVLWFFLIMIATVPALVLYLVGVLLSPDLSVIGQTWDIPFRILGATAVLIIPTTALAMCYSSFTSESRYVTFSWFATWAMGFVAYQVLTFAGIRGGPRGPGRRRGPPNWDELGVDFDKYLLVSPYHTLGKVQEWVFGLNRTDGSLVPAIVVLMVVTVVGTWLVRHRIIARLSV